MRKLPIGKRPKPNSPPLVTTDFKLNRKANSNFKRFLESHGITHKCQIDYMGLFEKYPLLRAYKESKMYLLDHMESFEGYRDGCITRYLVLHPYFEGDTIIEFAKDAGIPFEIHPPISDWYNPGATSCIILTLSTKPVEK